MTFDGLDPSLSDLAASEYRDTLIRLVLRARALATGEPIDPDAYRKDWRKGPSSDYPEYDPEQDQKR
jgi:hypothetical protein